LRSAGSRASDSFAKHSAWLIDRICHKYQSQKQKDPPKRVQCVNSMLLLLNRSRCDGARSRRACARHLELVLPDERLSRGVAPQSAAAAEDDCRHRGTATVSKPARRSLQSCRWLGSQRGRRHSLANCDSDLMSRWAHDPPVKVVVIAGPVPSSPSRLLFQESVADGTALLALRAIAANSIGPLLLPPGLTANTFVVGAVITRLGGTRISGAGAFMWITTDADVAG